MRRHVGAAMAMMLGGAALPPPAQSMTLLDAMKAAYGNNPSLDAQRATLRATDEDDAIARAQGRPQADVGASYTRGVTGLRPLAGYNQAIVSGVSATIPVYQGGRVRNAVAAADLRSDAGRSQLKAVEGDTFVDVVTAYTDVLRDREIVSLNRQNVEALDRIRQSSETRLRLGDATRTDVSQALARIATGSTGLADGEAELVASEQAFRRVVGLDPTVLDQPPPLPSLPASADEAATVAIRTNSALDSLAKSVAAAERDIRQASAAWLPTASLGAGGNYYSYRDRFAGIGNRNDFAGQVGATVSLPLYQGGVVAARVRQARDHLDEAVRRRDAAERQIDTDARAAFAAYSVATGNIALFKNAVAANSDALAGVQIEVNAGERQILDLLNAQLEWLNSRVSLARAFHDAYIAGYRLLNIMGLADAAHLGLAGNVYDPMVNFRRATHAISDFPGHASRAGQGYGPVEPEGP